MEGRVNGMALESIGGKSNLTYTEAAKQTVSRDIRPVQAREHAPETTKKTVVQEPVRGYEQETAKNEEDVSRRVKSVLDQANKKMGPAKTKCEFSYHEDTKRVSIKVINQDTEEVIREIPPEETLEMLTKMWELAGILVDEKR